GGARAAGRKTGRIENGAWADLLALDMGHIDLAELDGDTALDSFIFAGSNAMVGDVWSAGRHIVRAGRHVNRDRIIQAYTAATRELRDLL
ncbi:MAG: formimidoylglutamate deiminase, partial [Pseudomonadota bacterium]